MLVAPRRLGARLNAISVETVRVPDRREPGHVTTAAQDRLPAPSRDPRARMAGIVPADAGMSEAVAFPGDSSLHQAVAVSQHY